MSELTDRFRRDGFVLHKACWSDAELSGLEPILLRFHAAWMADNEELYRTRAVNSAYLTAPHYLSRGDRLALLRFVGSQRIADLVAPLFPQPPAFLNTQLFFNPVNAEQKNYWHRDIQYTGMSEDEQRRALQNSNVIHVRVAIREERGLELVPGSHRRWDTAEEAQVRLERDGHRCHENISSGYQVPMARGDLLIFSANMIHRGLYGMDRLAFDMLFCDPDPTLLQFAGRDCLPREEEYELIENPGVFRRTVLSKTN